MAVQFGIDDAATFFQAVDVLSSIETRPRTQNFAVAIAVLLHRNLGGESDSRRILHPPADSSKLVSTAEMQRRICDPTWEKAPQILPVNATASIYKPFTNGFYPAANNNWRNSFDLQAGLACDAPATPDFLLSDEYLSEPRFYCAFRNVETASCSSPAGLIDSNRTCFNPNKRNAGQVPGPTTRARHLPKLLTRGYSADNASGYWYVEPNVDVLTDLLGASESRIPLFAFIAALYCGSPYWREQGREVSEMRFRSDLALDHERFLTLFDTDVNLPANSSMLSFSLTGTSSETGGLSYRATVGVRDLSTPVVFTPRQDADLTRRAGEQADPERRLRLLERATTGHRRTLNELAEILSAVGYSIDEQLDGYDLHAIRNGNEYLFEVKTWTEANLLKQIRSGWAQLYEYRYRNSLSEAVVLCLVFDRPPPENVWVWPWLIGELNVVPCWIEKGAIETFAEFRQSLPRI